jgi:hypothetical protein
MLAQSFTPLTAVLSAQVSNNAHFTDFAQSATANSPYVSRELLCLTFGINRWVKLGKYFEFMYCLTDAEPSLKIELRSLTAFPLYEMAVLQHDIVLLHINSLLGNYREKSRCATAVGK